MQKISAAISVPGIMGRCGKKDVFLGFAPASLLFLHSFADVLDEDSGLGYQRPRNRSHSLDFKRYILSPDSSTIPLTFNLRAELSTHWEIQSDGATALLWLQKDFPCLAQVDCQHRLGELSDSDIPLAFMAFVGLDVRNEMAIFTVINSKARGLSSSLTDYNRSLLQENLEVDAPYLLLARRLNEDPASPWFRLIRYGGHVTSGLKRRTSLRMMQTALRRMLSQTQVMQLLSFEDFYRSIRSYWIAVSEIFKSDWEDPRKSLITKGVGLYAMTKLLAEVLCRSSGSDYLDVCQFKRILEPLKGKIDWSTHGPMGSLGGQKGAAEVFGILKRIALP